MEIASLHIPGFQIAEQLYAGSRTLIYRAVRESDRQSVAIKVLKRARPSFSELVQFRNQYAIAKNLNLPNVIKPYSLKPCHNGYAIVMEDFGGISLSTYLRSQQTDSTPDFLLPISQFLAISLQLADILNGLYRYRVIHKDFKPANILIEPNTQQIKLIDFSIASLLPRETQEIQSPNVLEGTLSYLSPEQTGRMNRGIDYCSDFYSLGVTFFEMLTGQLPFYSHDPMEIVHSHIAKQPPCVHSLNPEIPPVLSAIVSKLMAKNAENRYQSALGLKRDLEHCLHQWRETGAISPIELGQRDACDRFIIPEKLYGRQKEVQKLLDAFERTAQGRSEIILVAGLSGIGKTAVVNEVHKPIVRQRGYFIKGKFDQFNRNIPFSAFVQALRDLLGQLLSENDAQLKQWQSSLLAALGDNAQVIIEVIPELEQIVGKQPAAQELSGSAAQNRFNLLFQKFIQVFATEKHPLVIFLDDLQWADSASLQLMKLLMSETGTPHLLLIGAYRDNEVSPAHPLLLTLEDLKKAEAKIATITLTPLDKSSLNQLVADTLSCSLELALPLTELVMSKTKGNPFFSTQFLKALHEEGLIAFNFESGCWESDITQVRSLALTSDVVEFMAGQLQKLPAATQKVLKLAACIGNQFDLNTLAIVYEKSQEETATDLWKALQEGLALPTNDIYKFYQAKSELSCEAHEQRQLAVADEPLISYKFLHDRVQQAAYSLIPDDQKQFTHLKIGQLLLSATTEVQREEKIFEIVNQLNQGAELITSPTEREELAKLNLAAAQRAKYSTAYAAAIEYSTKGIELLSANCWQQRYKLTLALHEIAAEVTCLAGDFKEMEQLVERVLKNARQLLDKVKVYEVRILAYVAQSLQPKAIKTALSVLELFEVVFPEQPTQADITQSLQQTQDALKEKQLEDLLELPEMKEPHALAVMRILASVTAAVYQAMPALLPLIVFKQVRLSVQYGNAAVSAQAYAWYGVILCDVIGDIDAGDRAGQLALELLSRLKSQEFKASTINMVYPFVKPWKHHIQQSLSPLLDGYHSGLENGTLEYAAYCAYNYCSLSFFLGKDLSILEQEMAAYSQALAQIKQEVAHNYLKIFYQSVLNLAGQSECPWQFQGAVYHQEMMLPLHQSANDIYAMGTLYVNKLILCYLFKEWQQGIEMAARAKEYLNGVSGSFMVPVFHFYDSLTHLALLPDAQGLERDRLHQRVIANQEKLKHWAHYAPTNHLHKFYLVEAEHYRVLGRIYEAMDYYDLAIEGAKENGYLNEEALANELAARLYLERGKERIAQDYLFNAYYAYARWGAKAKVKDLEQRYPKELAPVLQHIRTPFAPDETITATDTIASSHPNTGKSVTSNSSPSAALDLATILKASQTLSGEIQLEKLLDKLLQVVIENAGADKCALMLLKEDRLVVEAMAQIGRQPIVLQSLPLEDSQDLPVGLINIVKRTLQPSVVINAIAHPLLIAEPYIIREQPKSLLCAPILHQGKLLGLLYLENNLTIGAFTSERVEILNLLCTQAAISLENARLFQQAQQTLDNLCQSQQLLRLVIDNIPQQVCWKDRNSVYLGCNQQGAKTSGVGSPEKIIGKTDYDLPWTKEEADWYRACDRRVMELGKPELHIIETQQQADGKQAWLDTSKIPLQDVHGNVIGIVVAVEDITERKQAEQLLKQQKEDLEQALQELQTMQLQLVQSEKMSALGNLVAGVAHEINNPVGFIAGNLEPAKNYVKDLFGLIALYQEKFPHPGAEIEDEIDTIDLDYLQEDLPKLLESMNLGVERICNISTSLRTFSRADQDYKVPFDIHEGIDSTILILKHRLKASDERPAIEVVKDYGELPQVECFPGQLNQVFMNILANAIDALEESNRGKSFAEIAANPNRIAIATRLSKNKQQVEIEISDNGLGMTEAVKNRIFEHLFTTKAVGKGTGLGLTIVRQIVVEKHQGIVEVNSELGRGTEFIIMLPLHCQKTISASP